MKKNNINKLVFLVSILTLAGVAMPTKGMLPPLLSNSSDYLEDNDDLKLLDWGGATMGIVDYQHTLHGLLECDRYNKEHAQNFGLTIEQYNKMLLALYYKMDGQELHDDQIKTVKEGLAPLSTTLKNSNKYDQTGKTSRYILFRGEAFLKLLGGTLNEPMILQLALWNTID